MSEISLRRYCSADRQSWNEFVAASRNATFLFDRGYMDYHAERFADHSMIALKAGRPVALLPANIREEAGRSVLQSHGGLTYGGWILPARHFDASDMLRLFDMLAIYCRTEGISRLDYRPLPHIYHRMPSQEDIYALFRQGACLTEVNLSCAIDLSAHPGLNTQQRRNLRRAIATEGVVIEEMPDVAPFHKLLAGCLAARAGLRTSDPTARCPLPPLPPLPLLRLRHLQRIPRPSAQRRAIPSEILPRREWGGLHPLRHRLLTAQ